MPDLGPKRSADPFEELAGPVDDVHVAESRVALGGAARVREVDHPYNRRSGRPLRPAARVVMGYLGLSTRSTDPDGFSASFACLASEQMRHYAFTTG